MNKRFFISLNGEQRLLPFPILNKKCMDSKLTGEQIQNYGKQLE